jgi:hypothetical protein
VGIDSVARKEDDGSRLTGANSIDEPDEDGLVMGADDAVSVAVVVGVAGGAASGAAVDAREAGDATSPVGFVSVETTGAMPFTTGDSDVDDAADVVGFAIALDAGDVAGAVVVDALVVGSAANTFAGCVTTAVTGATDTVGTFATACAVGATGVACAVASL